jgi:hypothetical protein
MMREASTESSTLRPSGKLYVMTLQAWLRLIFRDVFGEGPAALRAVKVEIETPDEVMLRLRKKGKSRSAHALEGSAATQAGSVSGSIRPFVETRRNLCGRESFRKQARFLV